MKGNIIVITGRNKMGNYVYYKRGGVQMARAYQPDVRNPKTAQQSKARTKFGLLSRLSMGFAKIVELGFMAQSDTRVSARNLFTKANKDNIMVSASGAAQVAYDELVLSKGSLPTVITGALNWTTAGKIVVPITDGQASFPGAEATDNVLLYAYCPDTQMGMMSDGTETRNSTDVQVKYPSSWATSTVHVYMVVHRKTPGDVVSSATSYLGSGTAA